MKRHIVVDPIEAKKIRAIYAEANRRRRAGERVDVDHEIPLCGKAVSGLHVSANLRIIQARDNARKGNRFVPAEA